MRSWFEVEVVIWGYQRPNNWLSRSNRISMVRPRSNAFWLIMLSHPILKYIHKTITKKYFRFRHAYLLSVFFYDSYELKLIFLAGICQKWEIENFWEVNDIASSSCVFLISLIFIHNKYIYMTMMFIDGCFMFVLVLYFYLVSSSSSTLTTCIQHHLTTVPSYFITFQKIKFIETLNQGSKYQNKVYRSGPGPGKLEDYGPTEPVGMWVKQYVYPCF